MFVKSASNNITSYTQSVAGVSGAYPTENIVLGMNQNVLTKAALGGSATTGNTVTLTVVDPALSGGDESVSYTVLSGDTLTNIASGLKSAISADTNLQAIGVSATSTGAIVSLQSNSTNLTDYREAVSTSATETISFSTTTDGIQTAAIGGTKTTGNTITITVYDAALSGGNVAITYTVLSTDTLASIASGIASAINANSSLSALGVTATAVSTVVNISSASLNATTYAKSTNGGATETVTLGVSAGVMASTYNDVNELTAIAAGGSTRFQGTTNKAAKSVTINSTAATLNWSHSFTGNATLSTGNNNTAIEAVDGANNTKTNNYQISVNTGSSSTLTYDSDGNLTNDGTNSYQWDAENRLIKITYPGTNNYSSFSYDGLGRCAEIVETASGSTTSTKQFVWCGNSMCEARDGSSALLNQYYPLGQVNFSGGTGTAYCYTVNRPGSVCEMTDPSGNIQAQYSYDPYGRVTKLQGSLASDFQYAGYYVHQRSGLNLTKYRAYNPALGRWLSRDPLGEKAGTNLYDYVGNSPIGRIDPMGTAATSNSPTTCLRLCTAIFNECKKGCQQIADPCARELCLAGCSFDFVRCVKDCFGSPN